MSNDKPLEKWNTTDFHAYLSARHKELFGVDYVPFRGWQAEKGMLGNLIGTRKKPRKHEPALVKRFIDECFREYKPTREYPGISFGFMWAYKRNIWQRVQTEAQREAKAQEQTSSKDWDEIADWL